MTEELRDVVARNLRVARWNHNWSQEFVSRQTGLSIRTISRAETGKGISKETLKRLCSFYAVRLENMYLTDRTNHVPPSSTTRILDSLQQPPSLPLQQEPSRTAFRKLTIFCRFSSLYMPMP